MSLPPTRTLHQPHEGVFEEPLPKSRVQRAARSLRVASREIALEVRRGRRGPSPNEARRGFDVENWGGEPPRRLELNGSIHLPRELRGSA